MEPKEVPRLHRKHFSALIIATVALAVPFIWADSESASSHPRPRRLAPFGKLWNCGRSAVPVLYWRHSCPGQ